MRGLVELYHFLGYLINIWFTIYWVKRSKHNWRRRVNPDLPKQITPASSPWPQLLSPNGLCGHLRMDCSWPVHCTSSNQISSFPSPKKALFLASRTVPQFNSRHTTSALARLHWSSHTVPQLSLWYTSTLPAQREGPTSLIFSHSGYGKTNDNSFSFCHH